MTLDLEEALRIAWTEAPAGVPEWEITWRAVEILRDDTKNLSPAPSDGTISHDNPSRRRRRGGD